LNGSLPSYRLLRRVYNAFLFLNCICFPAYLIFTEHVAAGLSIFGVSLAFVVFLVPIVKKRDYKNLFNHFQKNVTDLYCEVELTESGIRSRFNGNESVISWKNITAIQETLDASYFFTVSSGIAVRKSAFDSDRDRKLFIDAARQYIRSAKAEQIEPRPVSAIYS